MISEPVAVFVCATAGQGDPPDNMMVLLKYSLFTVHLSCV